MSFLRSTPVSNGGRRIFIAIPAGRPLHPLTAFSLYESRIEGFELDVCILVGHCHVDDARNLLVHEFLNSDCDELMFIDSDMGWKAENLAQLLRHDRDVVGASYHQKSDDGDFPVQLLPGEIQADGDGLIQVNGMPTGFLKIHRQVFDSLKPYCAEYFPSIDAPEPITQYFERGIVRQRRVSGDYYFCHKWRNQAGKIYADPEIRLEHVGDKTWTGSLGSWLRKKHGLELSRGIELIRSGQFQRSDIIDMLSEWDNPWAAGDELAVSCIEVARQARGPIIECGSGLTSLVMAATGAEVHAIEHDQLWFSKMQGYKAQYGLDTLVLHYAPIEDGWYSDCEAPWEAADIVVIDGPPRDLSDRTGVHTKLHSPRLVLIDDIQAVDQVEVEGFDFEIMGEIRPFAVGRPRGENKSASNY